GVNEPLKSTTPQTGDFAVTVGGVSRAVSSVGSITAGDTSIALTLASAVTDRSEERRVDTQNGTVGNRIQDRESLDTLASDGSAQTVSNQTNTIALAFTTRSVSGSTLTLGVNEPLKSTTPQTGDFAVTVAGVSRSVSSVGSITAGNTSVVLTLASAVTD